jgi:site-specific DNA-methyltransferase (adenine-specific)
VIHGDCLDWLPKIEDKSIDLILCDLPYAKTRLKWDSLINMDELWSHYTRIIKDKGAIVLTANQPFSSKLITTNERMYKYSWIWLKTHVTGFQNAKFRPMNCFEEVLVFSKSGAGAGSKNDNMIYNPQGLQVINKKIKTGKSVGGKVMRDTNNLGKDNIFNKELEYVQEYTGYPKNLLEFPNDKPQVHPTQKPVALFEYLIRTYTEERMTVLDNCLGSGTTAIAAINTNRNFIGIEKGWEYCEIANKRIEEVKKLKA